MGERINKLSVIRTKTREEQIYVLCYAKRISGRLNAKPVGVPLGKEMEDTKIFHGLFWINYLSDTCKPVL